LKGLANELKVQDQIVTIYCNGNIVIQMFENQVYHERNKHIDIKLYFIKDEITRGFVKGMKVLIDHNSSYI